MNMYNPYAPNPYIQQQQQQDIGGLTPVFQNIAAQQASQNAAMQQGMGLSQQAGQIGGNDMNPMAMAMALRKGKPDQADMNAKDVQMSGMGTYNPMTQYNVSQKYGTDMYSPQSRMLAAQEF
jgi:hypothetical protein